MINNKTNIPQKNDFLSFLQYPIALTREQIEALEYTQNTMLLAGAGSGKTSILALRFLKIYYENPNINIDNILAITFSLKATQEIRDKIVNILNSSKNSTMEFKTFQDKVLQGLYFAKISTIHAFARSILQKFALKIGINPYFEIIDEVDAHILRDEIIKKTILNFQKNHNQHYINFIQHFDQKTLFKDLETIFKIDANQGIEDKFIKKIEIILDKTFVNELTYDLIWMFKTCKNNLMQEKLNRAKIEYKDILQLALIALRQNSEIRHFYQKNLKFIMLDEFQDTDAIQWEIIQLLISNNSTLEQVLAEKKLFIVGDIKQSIYGFRGAKPEIMARLHKQFLNNSNCKIIKMNLNFRSTVTITKFINTICQNIFKNSQSLIQYENLIPYSKLTEDQEIFFYLQNNKKTPELIIKEAQIISKWIKKKINKDKNISFKDFAILFRKSTDIEKYYQILQEQNLPVEIISGGDFYKTEEILDIFNLIKAFTNSNNNLSWIRFLSSKIIGLSDLDIYQIYQRKGNKHIFDYLKEIILNTKNKDLNNNKLSYIPHIKNQLKNIILWSQDIQKLKPSEFVDKILTESNSYETYKASNNGNQKIANINKLINLMQNIENQTYNPWFEVEQMLEFYITFNKKEQQEDLGNIKNKISLMTIHASKGLEFKYVILPQLYEKFNFNFSDRILYSKNHGLGMSVAKYNIDNPIRKNIIEELKELILEEEKRILYVALTRAKKGLFLITQKPAQEIKNPKSFEDFIFAIAQCNMETQKIILNNQQLNFEISE